MVGQAGTNKSALATLNALDLWNPRYVFFVGIAGALGSTLNKGDVVVADIIHGYEYGKIETTSFEPRSDWTHRTDIGLLNGAMAHTSSNWKDFIKNHPPEPCNPKVEHGEVASGNKVVDDPNNQFFKEVLNTWPKIKAVEMEGTGVAETIESAHALGQKVGFMMIRGISDKPRSPEPTAVENARGTRERDEWKKYAADTAAAFTISFIRGGLPEQPATGSELGDPLRTV
jgi:nucleoside phosphorylase